MGEEPDDLARGLAGGDSSHKLLEGCGSAPIEIEDQEVGVREPVPVADGRRIDHLDARGPGRS